MYSAGKIVVGMVVLLVQVCPASAVEVSIPAGDLTSLPDGLGIDTTVLYIQENPISVLEPEKLSNLASLQQLRLVRVALVEFPDLCSVGSTLTSLEITENEHQLSIPTDKLNCLVNLEVLVLKLFGLTALPDVRGLTKLVNLGVIQTAIDTFVADYLQCPSLQTLHLYANLLTTLSPWPHLPMLTDLRVYSNRLSELPSFDASPLQTLFLADNQFSEIPDLCALASSLQALHLADNPITSWDASRITCLTNLMYLYLNFIDAVTLPQFPNLPQLRNFYVYSCPNLQLPPDYFLGLNWPLVNHLNIIGSPNIGSIDFSEIGQTLGALDFTHLDMDIASFASLAQLTHLRAPNSPSSFIPTTCPAPEKGLVEVNVLGSAVDLCAPENLWIKMLAESGTTVMADDRECGARMWTNATTEELLEEIPPATPGDIRGATAMLKKQDFVCAFPLHSHHSAVTTIRCMFLCLQTPGCYSFHFRPEDAHAQKGECVLVAPRGGENLNYAMGDVTGWQFYTMPDAV